MQAAVSELDDGAQTPVPWRLSRSVAGLGRPGRTPSPRGTNRGRRSMLWLWFARPRDGAQGPGFAEIAETSVRRLLFC